MTRDGTWTFGRCLQISPLHLEASVAICDEAVISSARPRYLSPPRNRAASSGAFNLDSCEGTLVDASLGSCKTEARATSSFF